MLFRFRSFISLFFLLSFVSLSVAKVIHASHHEQQIACDVKAKNHFHDHREECHFCDIGMPVIPGPSKARAINAIHHFAEYIFPTIDSSFIPPHFFSAAPLRAPPLSS
jgi:hypothetical protein